jgi:hypothetical protein
MTADISRVSYDEAQQYRLVVGQQGRVLVDTDLTDGQRLLGEEQRREALDFVGPSGAPDGGYKATVPAKADAKRPRFDFDVAAGALYVGGLRVELLAPITYARQPDWLNPSPPPGQRAGPRECIVLHLREQEVGAVEDPELREVALGGPDSSQRSRILQQVERYKVSATGCAGAFEDVVKNQWQPLGLDFDPATMRLNPRARLQVGFQAPATPPDRCQPEASGGYLGADNQLIRVQVAAADRLVWGFDNASFLYRVEVVDASTLKLLNRPVDAAHQPRTKQTAEILLATARLPDSDTVGGGAFVAAPTGELRHLTANYDPDTQQVKLDSPLPSDYQKRPAGSPLFLRVWEEDLTLTPNQAIPLGSTGVTVTPTGGPFTPGAYWAFAVRPDTPGLVDPPRYLVAPRPPDGPRWWACCLAVLLWKGEEGLAQDPTDCRTRFDNLVELTRRKLGGCCTVNVRVEDALQDGLQAIIDRYRNTDEEVTLCLMPGVYELPSPLRLTHAHSHLTLEGCHDKVVLQAAAGKESDFLDGLLVLTQADNVTLKGLRFHLPQAPWIKPDGTAAGLNVAGMRTLGLTRTAGVVASIGVRPVHCANLTVRDCLFRFALAPGAHVFGAGVFAASECWGLSVRDCRFLHEENYLAGSDGLVRLLVGWLLAPSAVQPKAAPVPAPTLTAAAEAVVVQRARLLASLLEDASFEGNAFAGLAVAALTYADVGRVRLTGNLVRQSTVGFVFVEIGGLGLETRLAELRVPEAQVSGARALLASLATVSLDPLFEVLLLALIYPLPAGIDPGHFVSLADPTPQDLNSERQRTLNLLTRFLAAHKAAAREAAAAPPPSPAPAPAPPPPSGSTPGQPAPAPPPAPAPTPLPPKGVLVGEPALRPREGGPQPAEQARRQLLLDRLAQFERVTVTPSGYLQRLSLALHCAHNEVEPAVRSGTRRALVVRGSGRPGEATFLIANHFRSSSPDFATVSLQVVERCLVTGNLIANQAPGAPQPYSLDLQAPSGARQIKLVTVTGNVFLGQTQDLSRSDYPAPLNSWAPFNTQV